MHCGELYSNGLNVIIHRFPFQGLEAGALDEFDDRLFGRFYFAAGFDGIAKSEFAAVGDACVEI